MARVSGKEGQVTYASGYAVLVNSWTVNAAGAALDATGFSDDWDRKVPGRKTWSGTFSGVWDSESTTDGGFMNSPAAIAFQFKSSKGSITGNVIVNGIDYSVNHDQANQVAFTFEGSGAMAVAESAV